MFRLFRYGGSIRDTTIDTLGQSCPHTHTQKRFLDTFTSSSPVSLLGNGFIYLLKMAVFLLRVLQFSFTQPAASSSLFFVRLITEREREKEWRTSSLLNLTLWRPTLSVCVHIKRFTRLIIARYSINHGVVRHTFRVYIVMMEHNLLIFDDNDDDEGESNFKSSSTIC